MDSRRRHSTCLGAKESHPFGLGYGHAAGQVSLDDGWFVEAEVHAGRPSQETERPGKDYRHGCAKLENSFMLRSQKNGRAVEGTALPCAWRIKRRKYATARSVETWSNTAENSVPLKKLEQRNPINHCPVNVARKLEEKARHESCKKPMSANWERIYYKTALAVKQRRAGQAEARPRSPGSQFLPNSSRNQPCDPTCPHGTPAGCMASHDAHRLATDNHLPLHHFTGSQVTSIIELATVLF